MDVSSINSDLIRGNVTTIILKALLTEDRYGYDILREIEVKSGGQYKLKQPTLYSCLKRLEKQGLISSYWGDESDTEGGRRRYYALTDAGKNYLEKMQSEYEYSRTILDSLLSENKFDFENKEAPFDINSLRPYTKHAGEDEEKPIVVENKPENTINTNDNNQTVNSNPVRTEQISMFAPLERGSGSYDSDYRHTSSSVSEMLGKIDNILNNKPETTIEKTEQIVEKRNETIEEKPIIKEDIVKEIEEPIDNKHNILFNTKNPEQVEDDKDKKSRIDAAKKLLSIGNYREEKPLFEEHEQKVEEKVEILAENPNKEDAKIDAKEYLFGRNTIQNDSAPQYDDAHMASAKLIFNKYNEQPDNTPKEPEVKYDPKDIFIKYQPKQEPQEVIPEVNVENEIKKTPDEPEKTYKPEEIFDKYKKNDEVTQEKESPRITMEASPVAPASTFSFRQDKETNVNYRDAFSPLRATNDNINNDSAVINQSVATPTVDLKTKLFADGYKLRSYSRENTENYYSLNYIKKNRINRDCYAILYAIICFEILIGYGIFKDRFTPLSYATICIVGLIIPIIPFVIWTINPDKRVHANYSFRTSILNRFMLYLNLLVIVCLIGFFGLNADISNGQTLIAPILIPALLLLNIPISALIYFILYKTKKYHIS